MRALPDDVPANKPVPEDIHEAPQGFFARIKGWKTVAFHSLYGVPMFILSILDVTKITDITPLLERFMKLSDVPLMLCIIAIVSYFLRKVTNTEIGCNEGPK